MNIFSYIHIPFCDQKCSYCRFASIGKIQKYKIAEYVESLCDEITSPQPSPLEERVQFPSHYKGEGIQGSGYLLKSIYFGGGTPGVLNGDQVSKIIGIMKEKYDFDKNIEVTLETTPINVTETNVLGWKKAGVNRISMGVQTLNEMSLAEIKRGNKGDIFSALQVLEKSEIENISIDFIIGLPHVQKGEIRKNIEELLNNFSCITHISVYMLEEYYEPDMIIESRYDNVTYPGDWKTMGLSEDEYLLEYGEIKKFLEKRGLYSYEISNFAKPGYECRHNMAYWDHSEIHAFGLGAYGFANNIRYRNSDEFGKYYKREGRVEEKLGSEDLFLEKIMFSLRTGGISVEERGSLNEEKLKYFLKNGYLIEREEKIRLTDKGVLVMDYILGEIV